LPFLFTEESGAGIIPGIIGLYIFYLLVDSAITNCNLEDNDIYRLAILWVFLLNLLGFLIGPFIIGADAFFSIIFSLIGFSIGIFIAQSLFMLFIARVSIEIIRNRKEKLEPSKEEEK